ncbi:hypothetical protein [Chryseobacterium wanjuense]
MRKIFCSFLLIPFIYHAQLGINTANPTSTLDITAKNPTGAIASVDGLVIPRVDRLRAQTMTAASITPSTLVYISDISTGTASGTTVDVTAIGFYYFNGTKWVALITSPTNNDWHLAGNTATNPATNFIGTADNQPLIFKINSINSGFIGILPGSSVGLGINSLPYNAVPNLGNSAFGGSSLGSLTTGNFNSAFGLSALNANTSGTLNTAMGYQTLLRNTTGVSNTAVGVSALRENISGQNNTAVGFQALQDVTGGFNTALGRDALRTATTGIENIGIGYQAGFDSNAGGTNSQISTGSRNILLGMNTGLPNPAGSDQMNIGNIIFGTNINGTLATPKGNIGLGTSNPTAKVEIASGTTNTSGLKFTNLNSASPVSAGATLGVDTSGNVVTVQGTAFTPASGRAVLGSTVNVAAGTVNYNVLSFTLPAAGTYLITYSVRGEIQVAGGFGYLVTFLSTAPSAGNIVPDTEILVVTSNDTTRNIIGGTGTGTLIATVSGQLLIM